MSRSSSRWYWRSIGTVLFLACVAFRLDAANSTAVTVDALSVNLDPLIDSAAHDRNQFAVNIPHPASTSTQGHWMRTASTSTWSYTVQVPTAISLSFHASHIALPPSAVLTVTAGSTHASYHAQDVSRGGLWSRPLIGDTLEITVSVNTNQASRMELQVDSLQAGYRGLGGGVADHPHYRRIMASQAGTGTNCTQNYSCSATAASQGPAQATVAVLVGDQYQCTGTLLNNTRGDGTPYVLTARHCQTGKMGGGAPNTAESVIIYWDAVSACGQTLQSIYYGPTTQSGAVTVVEQQDAWLIKLDAPPVVNDAFYAGWDARGSPFTGGYSIHHALGNDKQYVSWYGRALLQHYSAASVQVGYNSTFWGVVNELGEVGAGSSGGALFDPNNNVVGSGSLANLVNGDGSAGYCPATPLATATASNVAAQYTALSSVWTSTADMTSTTGEVTLKSVLDPDNTGRMSVSGFGLAAVSNSAPVATSAPDPGPTATPPNSSSNDSTAADPSSGGKGGGGALDPFWLLLFSIPLALRATYSSRNPTVTGIRAARTAGNKPPTKPMASAHLSPPHSKAGETLKANTT
jgi:lysyl endopeptidase